MSLYNQGHHTLRRRADRMTPGASKATILTVLLHLLPTFARLGNTLETCPIQCRCTPSKSLMSCHRSRLTQIPHIIGSTTILELDHNHINLLHNGTLHGAAELEVLSLTDNSMLQLEPGVFDSLRELRVLRLGKNFLSSLPQNIFANNRKLQTLDLHSNYLTMMPDHVMHPLGGLVVFNISFNRLTSAELGPGFRQTTLLDYIDLSGNNFASIDSNAFDVMRAWDENIPHHLNLSYCRIQHVHSLAFHPIPSLHSLSLEGNPYIQQAALKAALKNLQLDSLEYVSLAHMNISNALDLVRGLQTGSLKHFQLSFNRIQRIPKRMFFFLVNLRHLDLAHNEIIAVENLAGLAKLEYLSLAHNKLSRLDEMMFEGLHELKVLDVSHNALMQLNDEPFLSLFNLNAIDISANQIQQFDISSGLESLEVLEASWNRMSSLRFLQRLRRLHSLDVSHNAIRRIPDEVFSRGQKVFIANFSGNAISDISSTAFLSVTYDTIDLSNNRLTSLAHHGWEHLRVLYLHDNSIYNLTGGAFGNLASLQELHLQRNNLLALPLGSLRRLQRLTLLDLSWNPLGTYVDMTDGSAFTDGLERLEELRLRGAEVSFIGPKLLQPLTSLRTLDLSQNNLRYMSPLVFTQTTRLQELNLARNSLSGLSADILDGLHELHRVDLSENPLDCTCELIPLCSRLFTGDLSVPGLHNRTLYQCRTPDEWRGLALAEFYLDSAQCAHYEKFVIMVGVAGGVLLLVAGLAVVVCRCRAGRRRRVVVGRRAPLQTVLNYKFVDETSLTTSSNSSSGSAGGASPPPPPSSKLCNRQWT